MNYESNTAPNMENNEIKDLKYSQEFALLALYHYSVSKSLLKDAVRSVPYSMFNYLLFFLMLRILVINRKLENKLTCPKLQFVRRTVAATLVDPTMRRITGKELHVLDPEWFEVSNGKITLTNSGLAAAKGLSEKTSSGTDFDNGEEDVCMETMNRIISAQVAPIRDFSQNQMFHLLKRDFLRFKPGETITQENLNKRFV